MQSPPYCVCLRHFLLAESQSKEPLVGFFSPALTFRRRSDPKKDPFPESRCLSSVRHRLTAKKPSFFPSGGVLQSQTSLLSTTQLQFSESTDRWRVPHRKTGREFASASSTLLLALTPRWPRVPVPRKGTARGVAGGAQAGCRVV